MKLQASRKIEKKDHDLELQKPLAAGAAAFLVVFSSHSVLLRVVRERSNETVAGNGIMLNFVNVLDKDQISFRESLSSLTNFMIGIWIFFSFFKGIYSLAAIIDIPTADFNCCGYCLPDGEYVLSGPPWTF